MGTSRSIGTPSGGGWTRVRSDITSRLSGTRDVSVGQVLSGVINAAGGLGFSPHIERGGARPGGGNAGGTGGRAARIAGSVRRTGRAVSGLGGFAGLVEREGFDAALTRLNLGELAGKPALEVVSRIAEELSRHVDGIDGDVLRNSLRDAIVEAAGLEEDLGYEDLQEGLQAFLNENGVAGLIELFLGRYIFECVWAAIESHVQSRAETDAEVEAFMSAVDDVCRREVRTVLDERRRNNTFDGVNWFGREGRAVAEPTVKDILDRLRILR